MQLEPLPDHLTRECFSHWHICPAMWGEVTTWKLWMLNLWAMSPAFWKRREEEEIWVSWKSDCSLTCGHLFCLTCLHLEATVSLAPMQHYPKRDGNCHPDVLHKELIRKIFTKRAGLNLVPLSKDFAMYHSYYTTHQGAVGFAGTDPLPWWWQSSPPWSAKSWHTPRQNKQFWFVNNLTILKTWGTMLTSMCMSSAPYKKSTCSRENTSIRTKSFPVSDCM